jgi:hypothetical protein
VDSHHPIRHSDRPDLPVPQLAMYLHRPGVSPHRRCWQVIPAVASRSEGREAGRGCRLRPPSRTLRPLQRLPSNAPRPAEKKRSPSSCWPRWLSCKVRGRCRPHPYRKMSPVMSLVERCTPHSQLVTSPPGRTPRFLSRHRFLRCKGRLLRIQCRPLVHKPACCGSRLNESTLSYLHASDP